MRNSVAVTVFAALTLTAGSQVSAQSSCAAVNFCSVTTNASLAVPALVSLNVAGAGTYALTAPTAASFGGYVQDNGPALTVKANRTWSLAVHTTAATNWNYTGTEGGVKPIGDLTWSATAGGTYAAITTVAAAFVTAQAKTNAGNPTVFFRTMYAAGYDDNGNSAGTYDLPLVFTLSAP
jgi:hypothetical protein